MTEVERLEHLLSSDLTQRFSVERDGTQFTGRIIRGGVNAHGERYITISYGTTDDFSPSYRMLKMTPEKLTPAIQLLTAIRAELATGELRVPDCVYCGEELESVDEARQHTKEVHASRAPEAKYRPEWYDPDPNGELAAAGDTVESCSANHRDWGISYGANFCPDCGADLRELSGPVDE